MTLPGRGLSPGTAARYPLLVNITHTSTTSESLDEAGRLLGALYGAPMRLAAEPPARFRYEASAVHDGRLSLARLRFGGEVQCTSDSLSEYVVAHCLAGGHTWRVGSESGVGAVPFLIAPTRRMDVDMRRVDLLSVGFDRAYFERQIGRDAARLGAINDRAVNASSLAPVLRYLDATARAHPGVFAEPVFRSNALQLALDSLLEVFPLEAPGKRARAGVRTVRRAEAYLEEHLAEAITIHDVAEALGVSRRELDDAFTRVLGRTPLDRLRELRLAAARDQLRVGDPAASDPASVARRWGFARLGSFVKRYRATFHESPEDTLRR